MSRVHLVIPSREIGGVEKRVVEMWLHLISKGAPRPVVLAPLQLIERLDQIPELREFSNQIELVSMETRGSIGIARKVNRYFEQIGADELVHFVLTPPAFVKRGPKILYTYPSTSVRHLNWKGILTTHLALLRADKIDVLDPRVAKYFRRFLGKNANKVSVTPGSFVDLKKYRGAGFSDKTNEVVFCGLLSREKQADRFIACLPEVSKILEGNGLKDCKFTVLGRESRDFAAKDLVREIASQGVDVTQEYTMEPAVRLQKAKVFVSLQRTDNYPSKSLLEGMACGALPVITDVGLSEKIVPRENGFYVQRDFSGEDLGNAISKVLSLKQEDYESHRSALFDHMKSNFSVEASAEYFQKFYWGNA